MQRRLNLPSVSRPLVQIPYLRPSSCQIILMGSHPLLRSLARPQGWLFAADQHTRLSTPHTHTHSLSSTLYPSPLLTPLQHAQADSSHLRITLVLSVGPSSIRLIMDWRWTDHQPHARCQAKDLRHRGIRYGVEANKSGSDLLSRATSAAWTLYDVGSSRCAGWRPRQQSAYPVPSDPCYVY